MELCDSVFPLRGSVDATQSGTLVGNKREYPLAVSILTCFKGNNNQVS